MLSVVNSIHHPMLKIPQSFISDLLTRVDITNIISVRIPLKRAGNNFLGLCPFHTEKTPSFTVSQSKQFYYCFGCGAHGSAINFIMQFEHLNFVEALESLSMQVGLTIPKDIVNRDYNNFHKYYELTNKVTNFFEQSFVSSTHAINYLKFRGVTKEICQLFRIGYAPVEKKLANFNAFMNDSLVDKQSLIDIGVLINKDGKMYSRFYDRIIFPIHNIYGYIVGFGGRTIDNGINKYINSPETIIFHKNRELYGFYEMKRAINNIEYIIVVEGYFDVLSLVQFGIYNVVATLGTAVSTKQIQILFKYTNKIIFCFDGDTAGKNAAWLAVKRILPIMRDGIFVKFLFLPKNSDPDTIIRKEDKDIFNKRIKNSMSLDDFFVNYLIQLADLNTINGKVKLVMMAKTLLNTLPKGIFYKLLSDRIDKLVNINIEKLENENKIQKPIINANIINNNIENNIPIPIINLLVILLYYPDLLVCIKNLEKIKDINLTGINILNELIHILKNVNNETLTIGRILEYWRNKKEFTFISKLVHTKSILPKEIAKNEIIDIVSTLIKLEQEKKIQSLLIKAEKHNLNYSERQELQYLIAQSKNVIINNENFN